MKVIKETDGTHYNPITKKDEIIYCPVAGGVICPYCQDGVCYIEDPTEECSDFMSYYSTWKDWEEDY
jgi:hypothetical protein